MSTKIYFFSTLFKTHFFWGCSAHLGAETFVKKRSKIHQKTLTQVCQILPKVRWKKVVYMTLFHAPDLGKFWKMRCQKLVYSSIVEPSANFWSTEIWEREVEKRCIQFKHGINRRFLEYPNSPLHERGKLKRGVYSSNRESFVNFWSTKIVYIVQTGNPLSIFGVPKFCI